MSKSDLRPPVIADNSTRTAINELYKQVNKLLTSISPNAQNYAGDVLEGSVRAIYNGNNTFRIEGYTSKGWVGVAAQKQLGPNTYREMPIISDNGNLKIAGLEASSVNTSEYTYDTDTCTQQVTNDVQDSYSFVSSLGGGKIFSIAGFDNTFSKLTIYEQGGSAQDDYLQFLVSEHGQTSIFTADASGSEADLTITADGDLTLKCANSKLIVFNQGRNASGAHINSNFINPFIASAIFG